MPSIPASIIRLTALPPPPPTPITFMRAPVIGGSSSMKMLMPLPGSRTSGVIVLSSLPNLEGCHCLFRLFWAGWAIVIYILRTIYCANGWPAYNTWSKNTTAKSITKFRNEVRQTPAATALRPSAALLERVRALRHECQSGGCRPRRTLNVFDQSSEAIALRKTDAHRRVKHLLGDLNHTVQQRAATGEHHPTRQLSAPTGVANF